MSTKPFRAAVNGALATWGAASFPTLPIIYENGPVPDQDTIGPVWLDTEIRWYDAQHLGLGSLPFTGRHSGVISAQLYYRSAGGTGQVDDIIDSLSNYLKSQRLGGGLIRYPQRTVPVPEARGWYKSGLFFPFTLDV